MNFKSGPPTRLQTGPTATACVADRYVSRVFFFFFFSKSDAGSLFQKCWEIDSPLFYVTHKTRERGRGGGGGENKKKE